MALDGHKVRKETKYLSINLPWREKALIVLHSKVLIARLLPAISAARWTIRTELPSAKPRKPQAKEFRV